MHFPKVKNLQSKNDLTSNLVKLTTRIWPKKPLQYSIGKLVTNLWWSILVCKTNGTHCVSPPSTWMLSWELVHLLRNLNGSNFWRSYVHTSVKILMAHWKCSVKSWPKICMVDRLTLSLRSSAFSTNTWQLWMVIFPWDMSMMCWSISRTILLNVNTEWSHQRISWMIRAPRCPKNRDLDLTFFLFSFLLFWKMKFWIKLIFSFYHSKTISVIFVSLDLVQLLYSIL